MPEQKVLKKFSLNGCGAKEVARLSRLFTKAGYSSADFKILHFENNAELIVLNKKLLKEVQAMAAFLSSPATQPRHKL